MIFFGTHFFAQKLSLASFCHWILVIKVINNKPRNTQPCFDCYRQELCSFCTVLEPSFRASLNPSTTIRNTWLNCKETHQLWGLKLSHFATHLWSHCSQGGKHRNKCLLLLITFPPHQDRKFCEPSRSHPSLAKHQSFALHGWKKQAS